MIAPSEIKRKAERKYKAFLSSLVRGDDDFFPLEIPFGRPKASMGYEELNAGVTALKNEAKATKGKGYTIEWETRETRRYGAQTLPQRIYFAHQADFVGYLGKQREVAQFETAVGQTIQQFPALEAWLATYPQRVIKSLNSWTNLMVVCAYFIEHPRPDCYIRELPIPVHTKFIENHAGILRQLLDELLPEDSVRQEASDFAERFYLRQAEPLFRFRLLDPELRKILGWPTAELALPLSTINDLHLSRYPIVIIENLMNFLTFPFVTQGIAIWGYGFGVLNLRDVSWLKSAEIAYWGDLDVQGFEILASLRTHLPQVNSLLMNTETFEAYQAFAVQGVQSKLLESPKELHASELELYQRLKDQNLRLEQERIAQVWVKEAIER